MPNVAKTYSEKNSENPFPKKKKKPSSNPPQEAGFHPPNHANHIEAKLKGASHHGPFRTAPRRAEGRATTPVVTKATNKAATPTTTEAENPTEEDPTPTNEVSHPYLPRDIHPYLLNLFPETRNFQNHPVGGRTKLFLKNWETLTNDPEILNLIKGHEISLTENPQPLSLTKPHRISFSKEEETLIESEIQNLLEKRAIKKVPTKEGQILSNLFLKEKKDGGQRPILNLKRLNKLIPYLHFKMEGLHNLKDIMRQGDFLVKLDLKDAYFTLPLGQGSRKLVNFEWKGDCFEFQVLCFGLASAPRLFTKTLKIPISILRKLGVRLIAYLDDFLLLGRSKKEIMRARDSMIFILEQLGFIINYGKSILTPCKRLEFLGVIVDSNTMTLSLPDNKVQNLTQICQKAESSKSMTAQNLAKLVGKLAATMPAVTHSMIQIRYLQRCLRSSLQTNPSYQANIILSRKALLELKWWRVNLSLLQGKPLILHPPDMIIQSDAAKTGGGAPTAKE